MTQIQINLSDSLETFVAAQAAVEGYASAGEYVVALLQKAQQAQRLADFEAKIREGVEELDRGEGRPMTKADWDELRSYIRARHLDPLLPP